MRVTEIGNIGERTTLENIPKTGIIIEASVEELKKLPQVLYREVEVVAKDGGATL